MMADSWQTIEQAAVTLRLSVRTVNRHITAGKLQSRLFEGRREVLVSGLDPEAFQPRPSSATGSSTSAAEPNFTFGSNAGTAPSHRMPGSMGSAMSGDFGQGAGFGGTDRMSSDREGSFGGEAVVQDPHRQRVTPEVPSERPWDVQTMLALTDSIDDKATLAVAAYQSLARSAETQVQSLRKVAFGAWAVVGVMAVGITVAVGWAAVTITSAEKSASYLKEQLDHSRRENEKLEDKVQVYETKASDENSSLKGQQGEVQALRNDLTQLKVQVSQKLSAQPEPVGRMSFPTPSTVSPSPALPPATGIPVGSPTTQGSRSPSGGGGTPGSRPATFPAPHAVPAPNPFGTR